MGTIARFRFMKKSDLMSKVKRGDVIEYKFLETDAPKRAVVASKKPDHSGVYINGIIEDTFFMISADEIIDVVEGQKA
jgi:hypothetical protein